MRFSPDDPAVHPFGHDPERDVAAKVEYFRRGRRRRLCSMSEIQNRQSIPHNLYEFT